MYQCRFVSTHKKRSGRTKATWEARFRGIESEIEHIWHIWEDGHNLMLAAGHLPEHASEDHPIFVYLDIEGRKIRECMTKGWKPMNRKEAHEKFVHDAGRYTKEEVREAQSKAPLPPNAIDLSEYFPREAGNKWNR